MPTLRDTNGDELTPARITAPELLDYKRLLVDQRVSRDCPRIAVAYQQ
jgi:hypothetical protein